MKKNVKKTVLIIVIVAVILSLIPVPIGYKDGGTVRWYAVLYRVTKQHSLADGPDYGTSGYNIGTIVEILGFKVYDDVEFVPDY